MSKHEVKKKPVMVAPEGQRLGGPGTRSKNPKKFDKNGDGERSANPNKKAMNRLMARRSDFDKSPPCVGEPTSNNSNRQDHGLNRKGNVAKRPGSMKA